MSHEISQRVTILIDECDIVEAMSSGCGISLGTIARRAIDSWTSNDIEALRHESTDDEIEAVEAFLRAMKPTVIRHVTLHCTSCDQMKPYSPTEAGEDLPDAVDTIKTDGCNLCEDGSSFVTETWLDADGKTVEQDIH